MHIVACIATSMLMKPAAACYFTAQEYCDAYYIDKVACGSSTRYNGCYISSDCCDPGASATGGSFCIRGDNCECWFNDKVAGYCGGGTVLVLLSIVGCVVVCCCIMCCGCCNAVGECCKSMTECIQNVFCCGCCCPNNRTTTKTTIINNVKRETHLETRRVTLNPVQEALRHPTGRYEMAESGVPIPPVALPVRDDVSKGPWRDSLSTPPARAGTYEPPKNVNGSTA